MFIFQTFDFQICTEYTGKMKPTIIRVGLDEIKVETTDNPGTTATAPPTTTSTITTPLQQQHQQQHLQQQPLQLPHQKVFSWKCFFY